MGYLSFLQPRSEFTELFLVYFWLSLRSLGPHSDLGACNVFSGLQIHLILSFAHTSLIPKNVCTSELPFAPGYAWICRVPHRLTFAHLFRSWCCCLGTKGNFGMWGLPGSHATGLGLNASPDLSLVGLVCWGVSKLVPVLRLSWRLSAFSTCPPHCKTHLFALFNTPTFSIMMDWEHEPKSISLPVSLSVGDFCHSNNDRHWKWSLSFLSGVFFPYLWILWSRFI